MPQFPYDAVLFDLDGVLTSTSALHAACWKRAFEGLVIGVARGATAGELRSAGADVVFGDLGELVA